MKKFDINNYFDWEKDSEVFKESGYDENDNWVTTNKTVEYFRIMLNVNKLCKDYGMDEQWVVENIFDLNAHRFHLSQAVLDDGWYVNTDIDEQECWDENLIYDEIIPELQRYIERLIDTWTNRPQD